MATYTLSLQPFYDSQGQCYQKIITIDRPPTGPLASLVHRVKPSPLSPFQRSFDSCYCQKGCINAIRVDGSCGRFSTAQDIPVLYTFLAANGYTIDTAITQMTTHSQIRFDNPLLCFISY
jgi:hypothetical protein